MFKSTDGGLNWIVANKGLTGTPQIAINALAIDPRSPSTVYASTSAGLFRTIDGAATWTLLKGLPVWAQPGVIAIDPALSSTVYAVICGGEESMFSGIYRSTDAGNSWALVYPKRLVDVAGVIAIAIDPQIPARLYLVDTANGLFMSDDGGANWSDKSLPNAYPRSLAIDPVSPATLYVGTYSGAVFRTIDAGDHWTPVTDAPLAAASINVIAMAASAPAVVYAGGGTGIFGSSDRGETWTHLNIGIRNIGLYRVAVDPTDASTIYATFGDAITRTTDGGAHWSDSGLGSPANRSMFSRSIPSCRRHCMRWCRATSARPYTRAPTAQPTGQWRRGSADIGCRSSGDRPVAEVDALSRGRTRGGLEKRG